jgi:hypothetical protein
MAEQPKSQQQPAEITADELDITELDEVAGGDNTACANALAKCGLAA